MLILTRKPGESLFIGESVKITVMEIKGNQIRIGIDAPKELRIYREEIYLQIMEENKMASDVSAATSLGPIAFASGGDGENDEGQDGESKGIELSLGAKPTLSKFIVKPVSGLNTMKAGFVGKNKTPEAGFGLPRAENLKQPQVIIRKKKKPSEEG